VLANDKNLNGGKFRLDNLSYFQAIHGRHRDVEEYDIRHVFSYFADGISPIHRLANYFEVSLWTENLADTAPDALVVIYHEHTKCASSHSISGKDLLLDHLLIRREFEVEYGSRRLTVYKVKWVFQWSPRS
jgi:hypothetical protein